MERCVSRSQARRLRAACRRCRRRRSVTLSATLMKTRREFVKVAAASAALGTVRARAATTPITSAQFSGTSGVEDRTYWCGIAGRLASPLLAALAQRKLKSTMPVEAHPTSKDRPQYTYLEGLGRLLAGLAPWFELGADDSPEGKERDRLADLARKGIDAGTDPASPDFLNFSKGRQPLVDAAFLAQAFLRAPK